MQPTIVVVRAELYWVQSTVAYIRMKLEERAGRLTSKAQRPPTKGRPAPGLLPGKSQGRRSPAGCSPGGREQSDTTERLHFPFSVSCIGGGNGNPLQCSCPEDPRDCGAWWATVYRVAQSRTRLMGLSSSQEKWSVLAMPVHSTRHWLWAFPAHCCLLKLWIFFFLISLKRNTYPFNDQVLFPAIAPKPWNHRSQSWVIFLDHSPNSPTWGTRLRAYRPWLRCIYNVRAIWFWTRVKTREIL